MDQTNATPKRKLTMKQIYAMRARQKAEAEAKAAAEEVARKAARRRGFFIARARRAKAAQNAA
jgi:hypothetical protein